MIDAAERVREIDDRHARYHEFPEEWEDTCKECERTMLARDEEN